jgi:hypothetical protein
VVDGDNLVDVNYLVMRTPMELPYPAVSSGLRTPPRRRRVRYPFAQIHLSLEALIVQEAQEDAKTNVRSMNERHNVARGMDLGVVGASVRRGLELQAVFALRSGRSELSLRKTRASDGDPCM